MPECWKTPIGTAWIDEHGIYWHRLDAGVRVSKELSEEAGRVAARIFAGRPMPAIVDISGVESVAQEARDAFANVRSVVPHIATAVIVSPEENPASGVLAYRLSMKKPDRPIAIFEREADAVEWAKRFLPAVGGEPTELGHHVDRPPE